MRSAVRWFEAATSGKLVRRDQEVALGRCVLRPGARVVDTSPLPAGLSAALRSRRAGLSFLQVVPVRRAVPPQERLMHSADVIDPSLPAATSPADAAAVQRSTGSRRLSSLRAAIDSSRSRVGSDGIPAKPLVGSSAAHNAITSGASTAARATGSTASTLAASKAPGRPVLVRGKVVAGTTRPADSSPGGPSRPSVLQRVAQEDARPRAVWGQVPDTGRRTSSEGLPTSATPGRESSLVSRVLEPMRRVAPETQLQSSIKPLALLDPGSPSSRSPDSATGAATRAPPNDQGLWRHDVVPRRTIEPGAGNSVTEAGGPTGTVYKTQRRASENRAKPPSSSNSDAGQSSDQLRGQVGMVVALRGDMIMDGRKVGRLVATGQTSAASLPTLSGSAINLRAMPIFPGTSVAL